MTDSAASLAAPTQPERRLADEPAPVWRSAHRWPRRRSAAQHVPWPRWRAFLQEYVIALAITAACTGIAYPLYASFGPVNTVMLYLLATTLAALRLSRGPCLVLPVANILAFDFFFVPPTFSFDVDDVRYVFTLAVMLLVASVIAHLMVSIRRNRDVSAARERRTAVLYAMSRELLAAADEPTMAAAAVRHIGAVFHCKTRVLLADDSGALQPTAGEAGVGAPWPPSAAELANARTLAEHAERRRIGEMVYLPLPGHRCIKGVILVGPQVHPAEWSAEQLTLLDAFAAQLAMSLQRARTAAEAEVARIAAEHALLRNTLLASISHDLRTPLAAIAGAGSLIAEPGDSINVDRRMTLGRLIERKAGDMSQLLSKVLDLAKMELGSGELRKDWHAIDELVSLALRANEARLTGRRILIDVPSELPLVVVEPTLIVQILSNLLENAAKYTPPGTTVTIAAALADNAVHLSVADDGPGLPGDTERLFEKFQRGSTESTIAGVGLGLAICRAAARLHGGDIRAANQASGGARFEITLPVERHSS